VAKIKKTKSIERKEEKRQRIIQNIEKIHSKKEKEIRDFFASNFSFDVKKKSFFSYKEHIYMTSQRTEEMSQNFFFYKV
jgi:hypothetical protein